MIFDRVFDVVSVFGRRRGEVVPLFPLSSILPRFVVDVDYLFLCFVLRQRNLRFLPKISPSLPLEAFAGSELILVLDVLHKRVDDRSRR
jgi:hypothetical protein